MTAAAMIRRHGDIARVLRYRPLRASDREDLQAAIDVVRPVDDLPITLPSGRRDAYPANAPALFALAKHHHVEDSVARLLTTLRTLTAQLLTPAPSANRDQINDPSEP